MKTLQNLGRCAGVLLHPTSLPSGRLDSDAYHWVDWLADTGFKVWQMLPLGVPLMGLSPYQCASAFAIDPTLFPETSPVPLPPEGGENSFAAWYARQSHWVDDYALFMVLKQQQHNAEWVQWPQALRTRQPAALQQVRQEHDAQLQAIVQQQYWHYRQFSALKAYAASRSLTLFGDMPIFVAYDSADVWAHPERFLLDAEGKPTVVTGVPPDYFSATGQRWGNPHYDWDFMQQENFLWWRQRLQYHFEFFDLVRIDHFRGLEASWMIAADSPTAVEGYWQPVPGAALLDSIRQELGELPLVAEDLGVITPAVTALRDRYGLPGMSVLQFAFDHFEDNPHKPHNVQENTVYYTGTHDNDTLLGWFRSLDWESQQHVLKTLAIGDAFFLTSAMLETLLASRAGLTMIPMQDLLYRGSEARMNTPGVVEGNWYWKFAWADIPDSLSSELREKLQGHHRHERES